MTDIKLPPKVHAADPKMPLMKKIRQYRLLLLVASIKNLIESDFASGI